LKKRNYSNNSLIKAFCIIDLFDFDKRELSVTEIADALGCNVSSLYSIVSTLIDSGYLEKGENKKYSLGMKFLEKGFLVQAQLDIRKRAVTYLEELRILCKETTHLAVLDGPEIIYIDRHGNSYNIFPIESRIGKRSPSHATALGKVLLAFTSTEIWEQSLIQKGLERYTQNTITDLQELKRQLSIIRAQGYATDDGEFQEEGYCIAAPVYDYRKIVVAAVSLSTRKDLITEEKKESFIKNILITAQKISKNLGYSE
jgi:IclR family KDG regulon transcriptional repressor